MQGIKIISAIQPREICGDDPRATAKDLANIAETKKPLQAKRSSANSATTKAASEMKSQMPRECLMTKTRSTNAALARERAL